MAWWDFFRVFSYAFTDDPIAKRDKRTITGPGTSQPDAMPDLRAMADGSGGGTSVRLRDSNDFVDLSTVTNRMHRYKEYERLRSMAEIEMALTVFADESCMSGDTLISTPAYENGTCTLEWLAKHKASEKFLVYSFDKDKSDYTLSWAYDPRLVGEKDTFKVLLDDGSYLVFTYDHRVMMRDETWRVVGELRSGDKLMPFYRIPADQNRTHHKTNQYPRIFTHLKGWINERQFVDEWRKGKDLPQYEQLNKSCRMIASGLSVRKMQEITGAAFDTMKKRITRAGFSNSELKWLGSKPDYRRVIGIIPNGKIPVYDLSVEKHACVCTNWGVSHNCQRDEDGRVLKVTCKNQEVKDELDFLLFHRKMLNLDQKKIWNRAKNLFAAGDDFWEIIIDPENPKGGIVDLQFLPPDSMYRIETTKGKIIEFQQSKEGPDYQSLSRVEVTQATEADLMQATAIRFAPEQIIHVKIGDERKTFYPYGISLIEAARGPAHQLRMMEDAMVVYRLCIRTYDKIKTTKGWKYMGDITIDDEIYTYNQITKKLEVGKVAWHGLVGKKITYKVKSRHTSVTGTSIHPIIVFDKDTGSTEYVKIKDLVPGKHFFVRPTLDAFEAKKINRFYKNVHVVLKETQREKYQTGVYSSKKDLIDQSLMECGYLASNKLRQKCWSFLVSNEKCSLPEDIGIKICDNFDLGEPIRKNSGERLCHRINLPEYINEEFASLFGFLMGDGCISFHKRSAKLLFAAGIHENTNKKYSELMNKFFGRCYFQQDKRIGDGLGTYCVNSKTACEIMSNMGYSGLAATKRIPSWVFCERPEIRKAVVLGLADAEGDKRGMGMDHWRTTIRLCNKELVEDIKELWESIGLHASEVKRITQPERWINNTFVPENIGWEIYLSDVKVPFHDEIISVTKNEIEDVYDLTVEHPTEHNFLCNGVPVSNTRAPERRVFYIDVQQLPPAKAEAFMERMKDQFKKKKSPKNNAPEGASSVEERWHAPAADEDFWIPIRPNANTRVETLPGAQNLGEIDDTVYFRNKLFIALNFPKNYFNNEDTQVSRISLSAQDIKFARMIERLQSHMEDAFWELCDRHLRLRGFPEESYEDLEVKMTPPSDWRELTRQEIVSGRIQNAGALKGSQLLADYDILVEWMKYPEDKAKIMLARLKLQKLEELKFQIIAQNPSLAGVGLPPDDEQQMGSEPGPGNPMPGGMPGEEGQPPPDMGVGAGAGPDTGGEPPPQAPQGNSITAFPEPNDDDINKYNMGINDFGSEQDEEEVDASVEV